MTSSTNETYKSPVCEATPTDDSFVLSLATVLTHLVSLSPSEKGQITRFHAVKAPDITIRDYLDRIQKYFGCSNECFVLSLVYIDRIVKIHEDFTVSILNIHRLLITSVMLAAKFFDDVYYSNAFYARVGGVRTREINLLEWQFLALIHYQLFVSPQEYDQYRRNVLAAVSAGIQKPMSAPPTKLSLNETTPVSNTCAGNEKKSEESNMPVQSNLSYRAPVGGQSSSIPDSSSTRTDVVCSTGSRSDSVPTIVHGEPPSHVQRQQGNPPSSETAAVIDGICGSNNVLPPEIIQNSKQVSDAYHEPMSKDERQRLPSEEFSPHLNEKSNSDLSESIAVRTPQTSFDSAQVDQDCDANDTEVRKSFSRCSSNSVLATGKRIEEKGGITAEEISRIQKERTNTSPDSSPDVSSGRCSTRDFTPIVYPAKMVQSHTTDSPQSSNGCSMSDQHHNKPRNSNNQDYESTPPASNYTSSTSLKKLPQPKPEVVATRVLDQKVNNVCHDSLHSPPFSGDDPSAKIDSSVTMVKNLSADTANGFGGEKEKVLSQSTAAHLKIVGLPEQRWARGSYQRDE